MGKLIKIISYWFRPNHSFWTKLKDDQWYHICIVHLKKVELYIDGQRAYRPA